MPGRFPIRSLAAMGIGLLAACVVFGADPAGEMKPSEFPEFRIERRDGSTVTAKLTQAIRLKTEHFIATVEPKQIKRITFRPPGEDQANDLIELHDKSMLRGRIELEEIAIQTDKEQKIRAADIREIKAEQKATTGLLAIIVGLLTLTAMEIVLGIDNIIFLAIIAGKLPKEQQPRARKLGLAAALCTRLLLLASLSFLLGLTKPLFTLPDLPLIHDLEAREVSLRDLILLVGGLFLIGKSVLEIHEKIESAKHAEAGKPLKPTTSFAKVLIQIAIIDIVFSLDSVITAVGMVEELWVMMTAMVLAMLVMLMFAGAIGDFVAKHPTLKILALAFLILIGVMLSAEALGQHMDKGYIYFAMAFAVGVESINLRLRRKKHEPEYK